MKTLAIVAVLAGLAVGLNVSIAAAAERVPLSQVSHIHGIAADPATPGAVYLATHYGLYRALPDGTAERISETQDDFMGFTPHPADPKVFFASGHPQGGGNLGIIRSSDGGVTWGKLAPGVKGPVDFHAMDVSKGNPQVLYGVHGGLQVSRDGGKTWAMVGPAPEGLLDLAIGAKDPDLLYAATKAQLLISRDGGRSWAPAHTVNRPATMVDVASDGTVHAYLYGHGLARTQEGSPAWSKLGELPGENAMLHFSAGRDALYAVRQDSAVLKSADGGKTWQPLAGR